MIIKCDICNKDIVGRPNAEIKRAKNHFCSKECVGKFWSKSKEVNCTVCDKLFIKMMNQIKKSKSGNNFCSHTCSAKYNNANRKYGIRRSKLEAYLESELKKLYPSLEILFNCKEIIKSELDIYIPSLRIAFELNGIVHYEPIYGQDKFNQIINNDKQKFIRCYEKGIELVIIDTSKQKKFTELSSIQYLTIISDIISSNLNRLK
jgi:hypothetical protein